MGGWVVDVLVVLGVVVLLALKSAPPEALLPLLTLIVGARFGRGNGMSGTAALIGRSRESSSGPRLGQPRGNPRGRRSSAADQSSSPTGGG